MPQLVVFLIFVIWCENHWNNDGFTFRAFVQEWTKSIDNRTIDGLDIGIFVLLGDTNGIEEDALAFTDQVS